MSKYLVAPLNWGLGHASRCVPLVRRFLDEGHEVILGGDGDSLTLLRKHFPNLRYVRLAPLNLRYGSGKRQVWAMIRALPQLLLRAVKDHAMLQAVLREEHIDRVVSDNRFGLYSTATESVYITHQLHIMLPQGWRWLEPLAERLHARIYRRFNEVWVPDYEDPAQSLSGALGHPQSAISHQPSAIIHYIGPLSRFEGCVRDDTKSYPEHLTTVILSGPEPQRTMLERELLQRFAGTQEPVVLVQGLPGRPNTRITRGKITVVPYMNDAEMAQTLLHSGHIIARSGYSTIMDLHALGILDRAELIPTPGQPEQEYLARLLARGTGSKVTG
jgi:UDP:flavonoid glycosyltransferase YjiC (YdhE family)